MTDKPLPEFDPASFSMSLLARVSDLAHYAHRRQQGFTYVRGEGAHGLPITVIVATGELAAEAAEVGKAWAARLQELEAKAAAERAQN